jgi:hypothetical protein
MCRECHRSFGIERYKYNAFLCLDWEPVAERIVGARKRYGLTYCDNLPVLLGFATDRPAIRESYTRYKFLECASCDDGDLGSRLISARRSEYLFQSAEQVPFGNKVSTEMPWRSAPGRVARRSEP